MALTIPVWVLVGFAAWTLLTLIGSVGVYRWSRILTGRASVKERRADENQGSDWYRRAMRAHMNCVENLPVYAAVVIAIVVTGASVPLLDGLAIAILVARIAQTSVHIATEQTNFVASVRFAFFTVQVFCMILMGIVVALAAME